MTIFSNFYFVAVLFFLCRSQSTNKIIKMLTSEKKELFLKDFVRTDRNSSKLIVYLDCNNSLKLTFWRESHCNGALIIHSSKS